MKRGIAAHIRVIGLGSMAAHRALIISESLHHGIVVSPVEAEKKQNPVLDLAYNRYITIDPIEPTQYTASTFEKGSSFIPQKGEYKPYKKSLKNSRKRRR